MCSRTSVLLQVQFLCNFRHSASLKFVFRRQVATVKCTIQSSEVEVVAGEEGLNHHVASNHRDPSTSPAEEQKSPNSGGRRQSRMSTSSAARQRFRAEGISEGASQKEKSRICKNCDWPDQPHHLFLEESQICHLAGRLPEVQLVEQHLPASTPAVYSEVPARSSLRSFYSRWKLGCAGKFVCGDTRGYRRFNLNDDDGQPAHFSEASEQRHHLRRRQSAAGRFYCCSASSSKHPVQLRVVIRVVASRGEQASTQRPAVRLQFQTQEVLA